MIYILFNETISELQKQLDSTQIIGAAPVQIAPRMKASLVTDGTSLKIVPKAEPIQAMSFKDDTVWSWRVSGQKPGRHWIHLELAILVKIDGVDTYRTIKSNQQYVVVWSPVWKLIPRVWADNWQWLATTIVLPVIFFTWKWARQRRESRLAAANEAGRRRIGFHVKEFTHDRHRKARQRNELDSSS